MHIGVSLFALSIKYPILSRFILLFIFCSRYGNWWDEEEYAKCLMGIDMKTCTFELLTSSKILKKTNLMSFMSMFFLGWSLTRHSSQGFFFEFFLL